MTYVIEIFTPESGEFKIVAVTEEVVRVTNYIGSDATVLFDSKGLDD